MRLRSLTYRVHCRPRAGLRCRDSGQLAELLLIPSHILWWMRDKDGTVTKQSCSGTGTSKFWLASLSTMSLFDDRGDSDS